ncbi:hypothetical protein ACHQM5_009577 [Ranunculus cassubicifolius]
MMKVTYFATFLAFIVMMSAVNVSMADCNVYSLSPCISAFSNGSPPSPGCCSQMIAQRSCLCQYIKDPALGQYVNSPNARKVASTCGVGIPKC